MVADANLRQRTQRHRRASHALSSRRVSRLLRSAAAALAPLVTVGVTGSGLVAMPPRPDRRGSPTRRHVCAPNAVGHAISLWAPRGPQRRPIPSSPSQRPRGRDSVDGHRRGRCHERRNAGRRISRCRRCPLPRRPGGWTLIVLSTALMHSEIPLATRRVALAHLRAKSVFTSTSMPFAAGGTREHLRDRRLQAGLATRAQRPCCARQAPAPSPLEAASPRRRR
jgi:hypothetical protein